MRYSLKDIHSTSNFQNSHLWAVAFTDSVPNIRDSGGSVNANMPCTSVNETFFEISYDSQQTVNGIPLMVPQNVNYLGMLTLSFNDQGKKGSIQEIVNWMIEWADSIHNENTFINIADMTKDIDIKKYSREDDDYVWKSKYRVMPPDKLEFAGSNDASLSEYSVTLPIVGVYKLQQK